MEKLFRLKRAAVPFFNTKYATSIYKAPTWESSGVFDSALEEVEPIHIVHGIKKSDCSSDLSGWADNTTKVHFTVEIRGNSYQDNDKIIDSINVRDLMDKFQQVINENGLNNL